jgi:hypothetical protein
MMTGQIFLMIVRRPPQAPEGAGLPSGPGKASPRGKMAAHGKVFFDEAMVTHLAARSDNPRRYRTLP